MKRIVTVIGARPQFVKAWPVSEALRRAGLREHVVHTGQHYDHRMSGVFFTELGIAEPAVNLGVGSGHHGRQTAAMLEGVENVLLSERPDGLLVYGDTNSTIAAALAAVKLQIPVAHVEAGLRSFNRRMPEEHNRRLTDHASTLLLCPTPAAVENLRREGISDGVYLVGDVMHDALLEAVARVRRAPRRPIPFADRAYFIATVHRAENTDDPVRLREIFRGLGGLPLPVVVPLHPRTEKLLAATGLAVDSARIHCIEPLGYLDMVEAVLGARGVLTDSGGLQKEAVWLGAPCITLRDETEWVETLADGFNRIAGASCARILALGADLPEPREVRRDGAGAAERCARLLSAA